MQPIVQFTGPSQNLELFGVKLLGVDELNLRKLLFTLALLVLLLLINKVLRAVSIAIVDRSKQLPVFWTRQTVRIITSIIAAAGVPLDLV